MKTKDEYWIIDTEPREHGYISVGSYPTQQEAGEEFVESCMAFLKTERGAQPRDGSLAIESKPFVIAKVVRRMLPEFGEDVTIKDVEAAEDAVPQHHHPKKLNEEDLNAFATKVAECIRDVRSTTTKVNRSDPAA